MALARLGRADYAAGGLKMLCHADPTGRRVAGCALRNALYLLPLGFAAVAAGAASPPFAPEAAVATGVFAAAAAAFYAKPSDANARLVFRASLLHLPVWMGAFLVHRIPNTPAARAAQAPGAVRARAAEFVDRGFAVRGATRPPDPAWPPAAPVAPRALPFPIGLAPTPPGWWGEGGGGGKGGSGLGRG
jgi:protoheme IX farnesyltransferase